jgi:glycosyltransferase involved in cell wall biosynthesis
MAPRVLIISPVRNEAGHIERVVRAVAAQRLPPARMIVIDDSSTDGTLELLLELESEIAFLSVVRAPEHPAGSDRLALAIEARNFNTALALTDLGEFTHVMKLDGDIGLSPDYLSEMTSRFESEPNLGLAGGVLVEPTADGGSRRIPIPRHHVHGALKLYSVACFRAIGGIQERLGWDTIDETYARMLGFTTRSFADVVSLHHRPIASADGILRGRARHGECAWILHYGPIWVLLRSVKVARTYPVGVSGAAFLYGYTRAGARGVKRVPDAEFRSFTRRELRRRVRLGVRSVLTPRHRRAPARPGPERRPPHRRLEHRL